MSKLEFVAAAKEKKGPRPTLAALLREHGKLTWSRAQTLCERGKVSVDGEIELDYSRRITEGARILVDERRPRPQRRCAGSFRSFSGRPAELRPSCHPVP